MTKITA